MNKKNHVFVFDNITEFKLWKETTSIPHNFITQKKDHVDIIFSQIYYL